MMHSYFGVSEEDVLTQYVLILVLMDDALVHPAGGLLDEDDLQS